jgi:inosine kinase
VRTKSIPDYNRWEFSRLVRRADCTSPVRIYSHIHPYLGGPERLNNTSGAGDAALAALAHDFVANRYHRDTVPDSKKHAAGVPFLSYSSLSRTAQYGNRVAYEVLRSCSPRLEGPVGLDDDGTGELCVPPAP